MCLGIQVLRRTAGWRCEAWQWHSSHALPSDLNPPQEGAKEHVVVRPQCWFVHLVLSLVYRTSTPALAIGPGSPSELLPRPHPTKVPTTDVSASCPRSTLRLHHPAGNNGPQGVFSSEPLSKTAWERAK